jgi:hypothetical protein
VVTSGYTVPVASFAIPLATALNEEHVHYINQAGKEVKLNEEFEPEEVTPTGCGSEPWTSAEPKADPGNLCIYTRLESGIQGRSNLEGIKNPGTGEGGAGTSGAVMNFQITTSFGTGFGTWAVTG